MNKYKIKSVLTKIESILTLLVKCGGQGSGVPGPCPEHIHAVRSGEILHSAYRDENKVWRLSHNHEPAPEHIQSRGIPPAWKNVHVNLDPNAQRYVDGFDGSGRSQRLYNKTFQNENKADKWGRVSELRSKKSKVDSEVAGHIKQGKNVEEASIIRLTRLVGIRPGGGEDTGAKHEAYGSTTLKGIHVVQKEDGSVVLRYPPGKKHGVVIETQIPDKTIAADLLKRSKAVGPDGQLFNTTSDKVLDYSKSLDGGGFKTKDHRTAVATSIAIEEVKKSEAPRTIKEYKATTKAIATKVSDVLGNEPSMALKEYIDPSVFQKWASKLGL